VTTHRQLQSKPVSLPTLPVSTASRNLQGPRLVISRSKYLLSRRKAQPSEEERFESLMRNDLNEKMASLHSQMNKLQS